MTRLPYAATQLIEQATAQKKRTKATPVGEPDGLNVYRTIHFNKATGSWLAPLLEQIRDPRIASFEENEDGLEVTFVPTPDADRRDAFPLESAEVLVKEQT